GPRPLDCPLSRPIGTRPGATRGRRVRNKPVAGTGKIRSFPRKGDGQWPSRRACSVGELLATNLRSPTPPPVRRFGAVRCYAPWTGHEEPRAPSPAPPPGPQGRRPAPLLPARPGVGREPGG